MNLADYIAPVETVAFISMVVTLFYNRFVSWRGYEERTRKLETAFEQYQKDISAFFETCRVCRSEVIDHHQSEKHVTPEMREQIKALVSDVASIKNFLMAGK